MRKVIFRALECPGDTVMSTVVVESLHRQFPGQFTTNVIGTCAEAVYANNPHWQHVDIADPDMTLVDFDHPCDSNGVNIHWTRAACEHVGRELGIPLVPQVNLPSLYLIDEERERRLLPNPYCVINSGYKDVGETKWWSRYQELVDKIRYEYPWVTVVQVGETSKGHHHTLLDGVADMRGRTSTRDLIVAVAGAEFAVGPITFLMHVAAALEKPYVCLATSSESPSYAWYPGVRYITRFGTLPCCRTTGCWRGTWAECKEVGGLAAPRLPRCMDIPSDEVMSAVRDFERGGYFKEPVITVGTLYTPDFKIGQQTSEILRRYAKRHQYRFALKTDSMDMSRPPAWSKIPFILDHFERNPRCNWFMWMDADCVVMDHSRKVESFIDEDFDFICGDDREGRTMNTGVFFIRNTDAAKQFLRDSWNNTAGCLDGNMWEQTAMTKTLEQYNGKVLRYKVIPRSPLQGFADGEYRRGDFIKHFIGPKPDHLTDHDVSECYQPRRISFEELVEKAKKQSDERREWEKKNAKEISQTAPPKVNPVDEPGGACVHMGRFIRDERGNIKELPG